MQQEAWHSGSNYLGFMPEGDVTHSPTWSEGAEALKADMRWHADQDDEEAWAEAHESITTVAEENAWLIGDEVPVMLATVDSLLRDDPTVENKNASYIIEDHRMRMMSFWLMRTLCDCPDED